MLDRQLVNSALDGIIIGQGATYTQQHLFNHFCPSDSVSFLEDFSLTFHRQN